MYILKSYNITDGTNTVVAKIIHRKDGWYVYNHDGTKILGGPYKTKKQALKRLKQIEYFKNHG